MDDGWTVTYTATERRLTSPDGKTTFVYDRRPDEGPPEPPVTPEPAAR